MWKIRVTGSFHIVCFLFFGSAIIAIGFFLYIFNNEVADYMNFKSIDPDQANRFRVLRCGNPCVINSGRHR